MYHFRWEIEGKLARVGRPGREIGRERRDIYRRCPHAISKATFSGCRAVLDRKPGIADVDVASLAQPDLCGGDIKKAVLKDLYSRLTP